MAGSLPGFGAAAQGQTYVSQNSGMAAAAAPIPEVTRPDQLDINVGDAPFMPQAPWAMDIDAEFQDARYTVDFAADCAEHAAEFVNKLGDLAAGLQPPVINPAYPQLSNAPAIKPATAPTIQAISYDAPNVPAAFGDALQVTATFPEFDGTQPLLAFPNAPVDPNLSVPSAPAVDLNFTYPTVDVELPIAPALLSLDVQKFAGVDFPTLSATAPVLTAIEPSLVTYIPAAPYTDGVLTSLKSVLQQRLDVGNTGRNTGLPPIVEEGIWNRGREREYRALGAALVDLDRMEGMGYALPPGAHVDARIKLQTEMHYTVSMQSRDVAAEQAKLEQQNIKDSLQLASEIEGKLIEYANQCEQRRFDAMKYMTEAGIELYNAKVKAYEIKTEAYKASILVYQAQIEGAKAQVDIYTAEIQAEKLKVDMDAVMVQSHKVRVDAALASIQVFEGEIALVKARAEVEQIKVSVFGEQVRAYAAETQVFSTRVEAYKAGIEAETAKQATYATAAQAYGTLVSATAKQIDAQVEVFKGRLAAKELEVETYKAQVQSAAEQVRAIAAKDQSVATIYSATATATASYNSALVELYKAQDSLALQATQVGVSAAEANGKLYVSVASIATDAAKVGAQVEAQLGASALGAVTFATHKSRSDGLSYSYGSSYSQSKAVSRSSSTSEGLSTSVGYSTSTSVSASTSAASSYSNNTNIAEAQ